MAFRISNTARHWFRHLKGKPGTEIDFDFFYFCFIAGIATEKKDPLPNSETTELIQNFPKDYAPQRNLIIALFLKAELKDMGIDLNERKALNKELSGLLDPNTVTRLSDEGLKLLNYYSHGGFLKIQERIPEEPRNLDAFLISYYEFLNPYLENFN
ncbi:hypothetical protein [Mucilaginibacter sp.]